MGTSVKREVRWPHTSYSHLYSLHHRHGSSPHMNIFKIQERLIASGYDNRPMSVELGFWRILKPKKRGRDLRVR